jgi:hypothetical protein
MRITLLLAALLVASIAHVPARADTLGPIDSTGMPKQWPDGPLKDFLEKLQRPDANLYPYFEGNPISCCGAGDVVDTKFRVEHDKGPHPEDTWYAWLKGKWVRIPPEKIMRPADKRFSSCRCSIARPMATSTSRSSAS